MIKLQRASCVGADIWFHVKEANGDSHEGHTDNIAIKKLYNGETARQKSKWNWWDGEWWGRNKKPYVIGVILGGYDAKYSIHLGTY